MNDILFVLWSFFVWTKAEPLDFFSYIILIGSICVVAASFIPHG